MCRQSKRARALVKRTVSEQKPTIRLTVNLSLYAPQKYLFGELKKRKKITQRRVTETNIVQRIGKEKGKGKYSCRVSCTFGLPNCTLPARWQSHFIIAVWSFNFLVLVESPFTWFSLQLWKRTFFPFQGWYILCVLRNAFMDTCSQTPLLTQWLKSDEKKRATYSHPAWFVAFNQAHTCITYDCGQRCLHPWWTVTLPLRWPPRSTLETL